MSEEPSPLHTQRQLLDYIAQHAPGPVDGNINYPFMTGFLRGIILDLMINVPGAQEFVRTRIQDLDAGNPL